MSEMRQNVVKLGWVSFFTDVASEMLYAVTPIFLTAVLGASISVLGLVEGVAEATESIFKGLSGWQSDRIHKRKVFILAGYSLSAISKPLLGLATGWPLVLGGRFLDRFGKGVRTSARDALIADSIPKEKRGWAFGLHRAMDTSGAIVGVLISLGILLLLRSRENLAESLRFLYFVALIPGIISVVIIFLVKDIPATEKAELPRRKVEWRFGRRYYMVLAFFGLFTIGNSSDTFLLLRAKNLGFSIYMVILVYLVYNASYALLSYPLGTWSDKVSKEKLMGAGLLIFAGVYAGIALVKVGWAVWPLLLVYGAYIAATDGVGKALISNLVEADVRGTALGLFNMVIGVLTLIANLIAGFLWDKVSPATPFLVGSGLALAAGICFFTLRTVKAD